MKKLLFALIVLAMSIFVMASCEGEKPECTHPNVIDVAETNSTCYVAGLTAGKKCADCGVMVEPQTEKPLAHRTNTIEAKAPTCLTDGTTEAKRCVLCLQFVVPPTIVPKLNHVIDGESKVVESATVEANCTESGRTGGKHCSVCYTTVEDPTSVTPPTGHDFVDITEEKAPTCQADGCTAGVKCSVCGEVFVDSVVLPKGEDHHDIEWTVDANDATKENGTCKVEGCDYTATRDVVAADPEATPAE